MSADDPALCDWAIVGDAPERGEYGNFTAASGRILWPLVETYAGLKRSQVYTTSLCKRPLPDREEKLSPEELQEATIALLTELSLVQPKRVLALGTLTAGVLLGTNFTVMEACSGSIFETEYGYEVVPSWHPAIALRPGNSPLQHLAVAIGNWRHGPSPVLRQVPPRMCVKYPPDAARYIAIDTEGMPKSPRMLSWAAKSYCGVLTTPEEWSHFFALLDRAKPTLIFHNALWDWIVLRAMGSMNLYHARYYDTMEEAYVRGEPSQGLKNLAWRYLRRHRHSYEDVVRPHWESAVLSAARERVDAGTTVITHSPKTGKLLKRPKVVIADEAKPLSRALANPELLAERLNMPMDLKYVPQHLAETYAIQDAEDTYDLAVVFGKIRD